MILDAKQATIPSSFMLHVDANELLTCFIQTSIEKVMLVQTLVVPEATPRPLLY